MIDAYEDLINSRDVIDRLAELEDTDIYPIGELTHDQIAEITTLRVLAAQGENLGGWEVGLTLIRDSYFEDYAREYADDSCAEQSGDSDQLPVAHGHPSVSWPSPIRTSPSPPTRERHRESQSVAKV